MTSPIPKPPEVLAVLRRGVPEPEAPETTQACVDCALQGSSSPLAVVYTVSGTVLCREHAVAARKVLT